MSVVLYYSMSSLCILLIVCGRHVVHVMGAAAPNGLKALLSRHVSVVVVKREHVET